MKRDDMAAFLERLGHRVVAGPSCHWYDMRPRFYLAFPHSVPVAPPADELRAVFAATRAIGLRHVAPVDGPGRASYALMVDDRAYDLDQLSGNTRSKIRRGLKHCEIRRVDASFVRARGRAANDETLVRLRFEKDYYPWDRYWDAIAATPEVEVWGALREGDLAAYIVVVPVEGCAEILVARSKTEELRHYPNNALVFTAVRDLIRRDDVDRVLFGLESLDMVEGVDQFKESMGFRRVPIRQRIQFSPTADRLLRLPMVKSIAASFARRRPDSEFWRKVQGLLTFHESPARAREESTWTS